MSAQGATGYGGGSGGGGGVYGYAIPEPPPGHQQGRRGGGSSANGYGYGYGNDSGGAVGGHERVSRNFAYPLRPALPVRPQNRWQEQQHAGAGYSGGGGGEYPGYRAPLPHQQPQYQRRQQQPHQPMSQDSSRIYARRNPGSAATPQRQRETNPSQSAAAAYRSNPSGQQQHQQQRTQPRYSTDQQQHRQGRGESTSGRPSMQSDRSIYIGFDPSYDFGTGAGGAGNDTLGVTPRFPNPTPSQLQPQRSPANTVPQPPPAIPPQSSSRRTAASSFYSQQTAMQVSPLPEEAGPSRHDSYASSAAIPSFWEPDEEDSFPADDQDCRSHPDTALPIQSDEQDAGSSLVRQASVGKRHKPTVTEIKSPERSRSRAGATAAASAGSATRTYPPPKITMSSGSGMPPRVSSTGSIATSSPLSQPPLAADRNYSPSPRSPSEATRSLSAAEAKELGLPAFPPPPPIPPTVARRGSQAGPSSSLIPGRRAPPMLNMDAVRDAEARGSLTSLPDLIRRATKLAAVLETERPGSTAWGRSGSLFGFNTESSTSMSPVTERSIWANVMQTAAVTETPTRFPISSRPFLLQHSAALKPYRRECRNGPHPGLAVTTAPCDQ